VKIEIGESLILSWLKHINNCQLVQLNWKPSTMAWEYYNEEIIESIISRVQEYFLPEYNVFKKNSGASQIIKQGEIDALGMELIGKDVEQIYAVDVAFHEGGLNYGDKLITVAKILSKLTRMAITLYGFFDYSKAKIIFASPKINPSVYEPLVESIEALKLIFKDEFNLDFDFQLICNEGFKSRLIDQLDIASKEVADTSELYMRSIQMYKMFERTYSTDTKPKKQQKTKIREIKDLNDIEINDHYKDLKIGALVRLSLPKLIQGNLLNEEEVRNLQSKSYSKNTFNMNYAILKKVDPSLSKLENRREEGYSRYYSFTIHYKNDEYLVTSEWFERNKPQYVLWLGNYTFED